MYGLEIQNEKKTKSMRMFGILFGINLITSHVWWKYYETRNSAFSKILINLKKSYLSKRYYENYIIKMISLPQVSLSQILCRCSARQFSAARHHTDSAWCDSVRFICRRVSQWTKSSPSAAILYNWIMGIESAEWSADMYRLYETNSIFGQSKGAIISLLTKCWIRRNSHYFIHSYTRKRRLIGLKETFNYI